MQAAEDEEPPDAQQRPPAKGTAGRRLSESSHGSTGSSGFESSGESSGDESASSSSTTSSSRSSSAASTSSSSGLDLDDAGSFTSLFSGRHSFLGMYGGAVDGAAEAVDDFVLPFEDLGAGDELDTIFSFRSAGSPGPSSSGPATTASASTDAPAIASATAPAPGAAHANAQPTRIPARTAGGVPSASANRTDSREAASRAVKPVRSPQARRTADSVGSASAGLAPVHTSSRLPGLPPAGLSSGTLDVLRLGLSHKDPAVRKLAGNVEAYQVYLELRASLALAAQQRLARMQRLLLEMLKEMRSQIVAQTNTVAQLAKLLSNAAKADGPMADGSASAGASSAAASTVTGMPDSAEPTPARPLLMLRRSVARLARAHAANTDSLNVATSMLKTKSPGAKYALLASVRGFNPRAAAVSISGESSADLSKALRAGPSVRSAHLPGLPRVSQPAPKRGNEHADANEHSRDRKRRKVGGPETISGAATHGAEAEAASAGGASAAALPWPVSTSADGAKELGKLSTFGTHVLKEA